MVRSVRVLCVLYGSLHCDTTRVNAHEMFESDELRAFDSWVPREICGCNRWEVRGNWRMFMKSFPVWVSWNDVYMKMWGRMRWAGHVAQIGGKRQVVRIVVGKFQKYWLLGRTRLRWKNNIEIDFKEVRWSGVEWINLAWHSDWWWGLVNMAINILVL